MKIVIEEEIKAFLSALSPELLEAIAKDKDPISLGCKDHRREIIEMLPMSGKSDTWRFRFDYYDSPRSLFRFHAPKLLYSRDVKISLKTSISDEGLSDERVRNMLDRALVNFSQMAKTYMLRSKEPITFSYDNKQVEIVIFMKDNKVHHTINIS